MSQSKIPVPEAAISILRLQAGSILSKVPKKDVLLNATLLLAQHIKYCLVFHKLCMAFLLIRSQSRPDRLVIFGVGLGALDFVC